MSKKMLIDATHSEETRVAVVDNGKLLEYDYESKVRKQLKGNIFLAKVTRVEPSLQAAFVDYGGNRHGFLPFSEIHTDYYRIPVADRETLIEDVSDGDESEEEELITETEEDEEDELEEIGGDVHTEIEDIDPDKDETHEKTEDAQVAGDINPKEQSKDESDSETPKADDLNDDESGDGEDSNGKRIPHRSRKIEIIGGSDLEGEEPRRPNLRKQYKIQEVIKRGQIMLVQVSKEERGNKGAAVTTYLSLPGRYCVLMPNSPRGGGVSRKISSYSDRRKLKDLLSSMEVPNGMSVIMRTAGVSRTKAEIKRDLDYLYRLWENIRDMTLQSNAPALINEEGNLIRRVIRDLYTRDMEEVLVAGTEGYKCAKEFMKMLMPSYAKYVKEYKDQNIALFQSHNIESQISKIGEPVVQLPSGGYLVINPTEALVSIDVNSGRSTKERHIEETALKTNLESADEVARQLRLRDLGGLVVIDFIDMEDRRNNHRVEKRMKDALSSDRARIQMGRISAFGLMELSRQRLSPSVTESQFRQCPHCKGVGYVRTEDGAAITALRSIEELGGKLKHAEITLNVSDDVAIYILNHKRAMLADMESKYDFKIIIKCDPSLAPDKYSIETSNMKTSSSGDQKTTVVVSAPVENDALQLNEDGSDSEKSSEKSKEGNSKGSRRRGKRGGRKRNNSNNASDENTEAVKENTVDGNKGTPIEPDNVSKDSDNEAEQSGKEDTATEDNAVKNKNSKSNNKYPTRRTRYPRITRRNRERYDNKKQDNSQESEQATGEINKSSTENDKPKKKEKTEDKVKESKKVEKPANNEVNENQPKEIETKKEKSKSSVEYEIINEASGDNKKKGWWSKFI